jgi:hypothetical protein
MWNMRGFDAATANRFKSVYKLLGLIAQLYYMVAVVLCFAYCYVALSARRRGNLNYRLPIIVPLVVAGYAFMHILTFGLPRYHFATVSWMMMYASAMIAYTLGRYPVDSGVRSPTPNT